MLLRHVRPSGFSHWPPHPFRGTSGRFFPSAVPWGMRNKHEHTTEIVIQNCCKRKRMAGTQTADYNGTPSDGVCRTGLPVFVSMSCALPGSSSDGLQIW